MLGDRADHVQGDDRDADGPELVGRVADVAAHDRAGEDEQPGPRQVGDGADRGRDVRLADERDRVDADPLAAEVVAVGLADGAERDLGDLRAAADDDDPLAEDRSEARVRRIAWTSGTPSRASTSSSSVSALDLDLDLDGAGSPSRAAGPSRRSGSGPPAGDRDTLRRSRRSPRAGRRGRRGAAAAARGRRGRGASWRSAGGQRADDVGDRHPARDPRRRRRRGPRRRARARRTRPRVTVGVARLEHQLAVRVLGDADDAGDVDAALRERGGHPGERSRPIVELDREPDRHADTSCRGRWYPPPRGGRPLRYAAAMPPADARCPSVQIFGLDRDQATRAAIRFFKERRVAIHQVDLTPQADRPRRAPAVRRTAGRTGAARREGEGLSRRWPGYLRMDDAEIVERLLANPRAAAPAARPLRHRGLGRPGGADVEGLADRVAMIQFREPDEKRQHQGPRSTHPDRRRPHPESSCRPGRQPDFDRVRWRWHQNGSRRGQA